VLLICVAWRVYGEININRFIRKLLEKSGEGFFIVLDGEKWKRSRENNSGALMFTNKFTLDLGSIVLLECFLDSESAGELKMDLE
jgi:hypothetical protein